MAEEKLLTAIQSLNSTWDELDEEGRNTELGRLRRMIQSLFVSSFQKFRENDPEIPPITLRELKFIGFLIPSPAVQEFNQVYKLSDCELRRWPMLTLLLPRKDKVLTGSGTNLKLRMLFGWRSTSAEDFKCPDFEHISKLRRFLNQTGLFRDIWGDAVYYPITASRYRKLLTLAKFRTDAIQKRPLLDNMNLANLVLAYSGCK